MKAVLPPLVALPLLALLGAPATFEVRGAEFDVRRTGDSAEVRIVYDLAVRNAACGWFSARIEGLPEGDAAPKAALSVDGKEYPAVLEERGGERSIRAFRDEREEGVRVLEAAKSVRLVLTFPKAACPGPEVAVPVVVPWPEHWREFGETAPRKDLPRLSVRFASEVGDATAEVRATFRDVAGGTRVLLRSDARSAGATLVK